MPSHVTRSITWARRSPWSSPDDRYLAEDAAERIVVELRAAARGGRYRGGPGRRRTSSTTTSRAIVAARMVQENGDAAAAIAAAPHRLTLDLRLNDRASTPLGAAACWPDGTPTPAGCGSGPRPRPPPGCGRPVAAKLQLDLAEVEVITPDVGGGFGVKINHPWPEEVLVAVCGAGARTGR